MTKLALLILVFFMIFAFEAGFIYSLPFPFDRTPVLLMSTILCVQYLGIKNAIWWIPCAGMYLDLLRLNLVPVESLQYSLCAIVVMYCVHHLLTNRSYYAIAATCSLGLLSLMISELVTNALQMLINRDSIPFIDILSIRLWGLFLASLMLVFLFPLAQYVRKIINYNVGSRNKYDLA